MSDDLAAVRARLDEVLACHAAARHVNPRDHGVVAIADLRAFLTAYDAQAARLAAAEPIVAAAEAYVARDAPIGVIESQERYRALVAAVVAGHASDYAAGDGG